MSHQYVWRHQYYLILPISHQSYANVTNHNYRTRKSHIIEHIGRATHFVVSGWQEMSKGGQKLQYGRLTHLVDQQICWYGWCWLVVPFVVSVPFDDKICWYGQAFRINILCNRPILLMEQICATVVVQFLQCSLHCAMWPIYICKGLLGQYYCIVCLFVCLLCELRVLLEFGAIVVSLGWVKIWKVGCARPCAS